MQIAADVFAARSAARHRTKSRTCASHAAGSADSCTKVQHEGRIYPVTSYLCKASRLGLLLRLRILGCKTVGSLSHLSDCCATCIGQLVVSRASFSIEGINNGFRIADRRKDALLDRQGKRRNLGGTNYIVIFGLSRPAACYGNTSYEQVADCRVYGLN